jgi:hypothetical protein
MRGLDQRGSDIAIPVFASSAESFAGTFLMSRANTGPRTQMFGIGKSREIGPHLGHQDMDHLSTHSCDLLAPINLFLKRGNPSLNLQF